MSQDKKDKGEQIFSIESDDEDEIFKPRKRNMSQFKSMTWTNQMYTIEMYLESGMYPFLLLYWIWK